MKRFQARRGSGRFTRNTMENCFGLHTDVCEACRSITSWAVGSSAPDACHHCGAIFIREKCAHGRYKDRFMDPFVVRQGGYTECGQPAIACDIDRQWGQCGEHLENK